MANEAVLKYLKSTNRPYSANDIVLNLHKEFGKTAIQRALDALVQQEAVLEKVYGKQKVYVVKQSDDVDISEEELKTMDTNVFELTMTLKQKESEIKAIESELKTFQNMVSKEKILEDIEVLTKDIEKMETKLEKLSSNAVPVSPTKVKELTVQREQFLKVYRSSKTLCCNIIDVILSNYPQTKSELFEEIGLETEESANIKLPQF